MLHVFSNRCATGEIVSLSDQGVWSRKDCMSGLGCFWSRKDVLLSGLGSIVASDLGRKYCVVCQGKRAESEDIGVWCIYI